MRRIVIPVCAACMVSCGAHKAMVRQNESLHERAAAQKSELEQLQRRLSVVESEVRTAALEMRSSRDRDSVAVTVRIEEEYDASVNPIEPPVARRVVQLQGVSVNDAVRDGVIAAAGSARGGHREAEEAFSAETDSVHVYDTTRSSHTSNKVSAGLRWWQSMFLYIGIAVCLYLPARLMTYIFKQRSNGILTLIKKIIRNG